METDIDMQNDPQIGNAPMNAELFSEQAICPYEKCSSRGKFFRCYRSCFKTSDIYKRTNRTNNSKSTSGLVEITSD